MNKSEARVLQILREQGESSVTELARLSGLGKATASRAIQVLRDQGLVEETGADFRKLAAGRAGKALRIRPESCLYLGLAIQAGQVTAVIADAAKRVVAHERRDLPMTPEGLPGVETVTRLVTEVLRRADCDPARIPGIGIAIAAPVDPATGEIGNSVTVPEWTGSNPRRVFSDLLGMNVVLDNDANCSALAELLWGDLAASESAVVLRMDQGVGGAIILGGQVLSGHSGRSGDYGHVTYDRHGPACRCGGAGCFERYLSLPAVEQLFATRHGTRDFAEVCDRLHHPDPALLQTVEEVGQIAGELAAVASRTIDPDRILFGGRLVALGPAFLGAARRRLHQINAMAPPPETATAATLLEGNALRDEPALGAVGLLIRKPPAMGRR